MRIGQTSTTTTQTLRPYRAALLALVVTAAIVRILTIAATGPQKTTFHDAGSYLRTVTCLCEDGVYPERVDPILFRAPGLPIFIAAVTGCQADRVPTVKIALALMDSLMVPLLFLLTQALGGDHRAALLTALAAALYPPFIFQILDVRSEPLFMVALTAGIVGVLLFPDRRWHLAIAGAGLGVAALTRPAGLLAIPFFALVAAGRTSGPRRARLTAALAVAIGASAILTPWIAHNAMRYREFIPSNDAFGYNVWRGLHPEMHAIINSPDRDTYWRGVRHFEEHTQPQVLATVDSVARTPAARSKAWLDLAMERFRNDPASGLKMAFANLARWWRPWLDPHEYSKKVVFGSGSMYFGLYLLSAAGLTLLWHHDRQLAFIVIAWLAATWLAHAPFQVQMRFRIPGTDPWMLSLASLAIVRTLTVRSTE